MHQRITNVKANKYLVTLSRYKVSSNRLLPEGNKKSITNKTNINNNKNTNRCSSWTGKVEEEMEMDQELAS